MNLIARMSPKPTYQTLPKEMRERIAGYLEDPTDMATIRATSKAMREDLSNVAKNLDRGRALRGSPAVRVERFADAVTSMRNRLYSQHHPEDEHLRPTKEEIFQYIEESIPGILVYVGGARAIETITDIIFNMASLWPRGPQHGSWGGWDDLGTYAEKVIAAARLSVSDVVPLVLDLIDDQMYSLQQKLVSPAYLDRETGEYEKDRILAIESAAHDLKDNASTTSIFMRLKRRSDDRRNLRNVTQRGDFDNEGMMGEGEDENEGNW